MINPVLVPTAIANGVTIYTDISAGFGTAGPVLVQATTSVSLLHPGGFPTRPFLTGGPAAQPDNGTCIVPAGASFATWLPESASLVAAGAATFIQNL